MQLWRLAVRYVNYRRLKVKGCDFQSKEYGFARGRAYSFTFNKIFSGRQPGQRLKVLHRFRDGINP